MIIILVFSVLFMGCPDGDDPPPEEPTIEDFKLQGTWIKNDDRLIIEFTDTQLIVTNKANLSDKAKYFYTTTGEKITIKMTENATKIEGDTTYIVSETTLNIGNDVKKLLQGLYTRDKTGSEGEGGEVIPGNKVGLPYAGADPDKETYDTRENVTVSLFTLTNGAKIYYTKDGNPPTKTTDNEYTAPFTITLPEAGTITIKAIAAKASMTDSDMMMETYTFAAPPITVAPPAADPNGGSYTVGQTVPVTLNTTTTGATIYYTLDNSTPTVINGTPCVPGNTITISSATVATIKLKAIAAKDGSFSTATTADYVFSVPPAASVATPTATPNGGSYTTSKTVSVTLATTTAGADIYYTVDGTTPTASSSSYTAPFNVTSATSKTITLKAIAIKDGTSSNVLSTAFVFTLSKLVTSSANSGTGSLRALITSANDGDIIEIGTGVTTIELNSEIAIGKKITIEGNGVILTPSATFPDKNNSLLSVNPGSALDVTIRRVHFKSGKDSGSGDAGRGSGIYNRGKLTVESCIFTINTAVYGGAINNQENSTTVKGCTFYTNTASNSGGAIYNNSGTLTLTGNLFFGNVAPANKGPAVYRAGGTVTSGGYNVSDTALVEVASGSWTGQSTDKTFSGLGITLSGPTPFVDPAVDNFAPKEIPALKIMPSTAILNFPTTDFKGNPRNWPGMPGAVN